VPIQLLLPTTSAATDGLASLAEKRRELAERFNGLTAHLRSPAKEWWTVERFRHESIHMRALSMELLDEKIDE